MGRSLTNEEIMRLTDLYSAHHYERYPVVPDRGWKCLVFERETGKPCLDMIASYSAVIFGRRGNPYYERVRSALIDQLDKLALVTGSYPTESYAKFCQKITSFCSMDKVLVMNTGAEAVEAAMKIARRWGYIKKGIPENQAEIIFCRNNFHGRTLGVLSGSSNEKYRYGFGPFLPGCKVVPFGDIDAFGWSIRKNTAAFIVEPIQGEGGINIPPDYYLGQAEYICRENDVLLVLDEVQTGFGRTGPMFAHQTYGVKPDLLILGKALGGGMEDISAVVGPNEIMDVLEPGSHGSTFGGNPLACAVACEVLDILTENPGFIEKAREIGNYFLSGLQKIESPKIKEVRGRGLLIGIEFNHAVNVDNYRANLLEEGILCGVTHERTLRFSPPLVITKKEINWALPRIEKVLQEAR